MHVSHVEPGRLLPSRLPDDTAEGTTTTDPAAEAGAGFITITLSRVEVKVAPGSGHDVVLMVGGGAEEAKRWTQVLKRAAHEVSEDGGEGGCVCVEEEGCVWMCVLWVALTVDYTYAIYPFGHTGELRGRRQLAQRACICIKKIII